MQIKKCDICGAIVDLTHQKAAVFYREWNAFDGWHNDYDFCEDCAKKVIEAVNKVIEDNRNA